MAIMRGRTPTESEKRGISRVKQAEELRLDGGKVKSVGVNRRKKPDWMGERWNQSGETSGRTPTGSEKRGISRVKQAEETRLDGGKVKSVGQNERKNPD